jgi:hypothetical protein
MRMSQHLFLAMEAPWAGIFDDCDEKSMLGTSADKRQGRSPLIQSCSMMIGITICRQRQWLPMFA